MNLPAPPASIRDEMDVRALKRVWSTLEPQSCPYHYNFHLHTVHSDGQLQPEALMEQAMAIGLLGLAITDHHSVEGFHRARRWLEQSFEANSERQLPHLWTGVEVTADLEGTEVHLLGYAFAPDRPVMKPYLRGDRPLGAMAHAARVIDAFHQAGGLAVLAHPERYTRPAKVLVPIAAALGIDGVETYYAYRNPMPWSPSVAQTQTVKALSEKYNLYDTCGTDTHGLNLLRRI